MSVYRRDVLNEARRLTCRFGPEDAEKFAARQVADATDVGSDLLDFWTGVLTQLATSRDTTEGRLV